MKSKRAKATEFSVKERLAIVERDRGCIFCQMAYKMPEEKLYAQRIFSIMHYISRSKGGLGIRENGALGCQYHHDMLDNGKDGNREEMLFMFSEYLKVFYPEWNEDKLFYSKY